MMRTGTYLVLAVALLVSAAVHAAPFSFGVIAQQIKSGGDETTVQAVINDSDADNLAFVLVNGVKPIDAPCNDDIYQKRLSIFDQAKNGLIVSVTASDWAQCVDAKKRSNATERLGRLRELFFSDEFSLGDSKLTLIRQSTIPKFRMYGENTRWRIGDVMFATINLPSNNNNYLSAAGRNSEFEDRQVANSAWLKQIFVSARASKLDGVVIFCDGNPLAVSDNFSLFSSAGKREGFADIRKQIMAFSAKFEGRVLIVHGERDVRKPHAKDIEWREKIGALRVEAPWRKITVDPATATLFSVNSSPIPMSR